MKKRPENSSTDLSEFRIEKHWTLQCLAIARYFHQNLRTDFLRHCQNSNNTDARGMKHSKKFTSVCCKLETDH